MLAVASRVLAVVHVHAPAFSRRASAAAAMTRTTLSTADRDEDTLTVCIDFKSAQSHLAVPAALQLAARCTPPLRVAFRPFLTRATEFGRVDPASGRALDLSLASKHESRKRPYLFRVLRFEAARAGLPLEPPADAKLDTAPALAALLFLQSAAWRDGGGSAPSQLDGGEQQQQQLEKFVLACFATVFGGGDGEGGRSIERLHTIQHLLDSATGCPSSAAAAATTAASVVAQSSSPPPGADRGLGAGAAFAAWWRQRDRRGEVQRASDQLSEEHHVFCAPTFIFRDAAADVSWPREKHLIADGRHEIFADRWSLDLLQQRLFREGRLPPGAAATAAAAPAVTTTCDDVSNATTTSGNSSGSNGGGTCNSGKQDQPPRPLLQVDCYLDIKSPYAYLAIGPLQAMRARFGGNKNGGGGGEEVQFTFRPFALDIPSFIGSARVGPTDNVVRAHAADQRSPQQWAAVRYMYADVRRRGALRSPPVRVRGTQKIWDTSLAGAALLWVQRRCPAREDAWRAAAWPRFWARDLDVEDPCAIEALLASPEVGVDATGFKEWAVGEGRRLHDEGRARAWDDLGVFGTPTVVVRRDGAVVPPTPLWGSEHLDTVEQLLEDLLAEERKGVRGVPTAAGGRTDHAASGAPLGGRLS